MKLGDQEASRRGRGAVEGLRVQSRGAGGRKVAEAPAATNNDARCLKGVGVAGSGGCGAKFGDKGKREDRDRPLPLLGIGSSAVEPNPAASSVRASGVEEQHFPRFSENKGGRQ